MSELDLDVLRRLVTGQDGSSWRRQQMVSWLHGNVNAILAALERAERVEAALATGPGETERLACAFSVDCATKPPPEGPCWGCRVRAALADTPAEEGGPPVADPMNRRSGGLPHEGDRTTSSGERIRAVIEEWRLLATVLDGPPDWDGLVEQVDRAVFGEPIEGTEFIAGKVEELEEHPRPWRTGGHPADEPGPRQRTIYDATGEMIGAMFTTAAARLTVDSVDALAELEAEVRMLGEIVKGSGMGINGIPLQDFGGLPRIAALLREPAAQPEGTHHLEE